MDDIKDIIKQVVGDLSSNNPSQQEKIRKLWEKTVGEQGLKHTRITELNGGELVIYVDSPAWLYQMNLEKGKFLKKIKNEVVEIKSISFKIGKTS